MIRRYSREEVQAQFGGVSGLGFSLKPPKWLKKIATDVQRKIPKGTTVNVDLGTGSPISVDLSDPSSVAALRRQFENAKLTVTRKTEAVPAAVTEPMSGNTTMMLAAGAAVVAALFLMRKR